MRGAEEDATPRTKEATRPETETHTTTIASTSDDNTATETANKQDAPTTTLTDTVYIGNLPLQYATEAVVEKLLARHGRVQRISVITSTAANNNNKRPFAFGQLSSCTQAAAAIKALHGRKLGGRFLVVRPAHDNKKVFGGQSSKTSQQDRPPQQQQRQLESRIEAIKQQLKKKGAS